MATTPDNSAQFPEKPATEHVGAEDNIPRLPSGKIDTAAWVKQLGIKPIENIEQFADVWPEDESIDDFLRTLREWRSEGRPRPTP